MKKKTLGERVENVGRRQCGKGLKRAQDEFVDEIPWVQWMIQDEFVDGAEWVCGR